MYTQSILKEYEISETDFPTEITFTRQLKEGVRAL